MLAQAKRLLPPVLAVALLALALLFVTAAGAADTKQRGKHATHRAEHRKANHRGKRDRQPKRAQATSNGTPNSTAAGKGSGDDRSATSSASSAPVRTVGHVNTPFAPPAPSAPAPPPTQTAPAATTPPPPPPPTTPSRPVRATSGTILDSGFESGNLFNWNVAGAGEVLPTVVSGFARSGSSSARFALSGNQSRSELILGGDGTASTRGTEEFFEGEEFWYGFSFYIKQMVYGKPGAHNLIMQFKSNGTGSPEFGLQLWDVNGKKGLWTGGLAQQIGNSGERFLSPVGENEWHDVQIHFKASEVGAGFYETFLDGRLIDAQANVSMIVPGKNGAYIKNGLYRNGTTAPGNSEVFIDSAKLGTTQASVLP